MMVIGLTGKACSGKNVIASDLTALGWTVVDVDLLGHPLLQKSVFELKKTFGEQVVSSDGTVDRKALGKVVFSDESKLRQLEAITHPRMVEECKRILDEERNKGTEVVVLNAALLHRMKLDGLCDEVLFVSSPKILRYVRANKRDCYDWKRFNQRDRAQKDINKRNISFLCKVTVIHNYISLASVHRQVQDYCARIRRKGITK